MLAISSELSVIGPEHRVPYQGTLFGRVSLDHDVAANPYSSSYSSPQEFEWISPDPDHHFSIAVR